MSGGVHQADVAISLEEIGETWGGVLVPLSPLPLSSPGLGSRGRGGGETGGGWGDWEGASGFVLFGGFLASQEKNEKRVIFFKEGYRGG